MAEGYGERDPIKEWLLRVTPVDVEVLLQVELYCKPRS